MECNLEDGQGRLDVQSISGLFPFSKGGGRKDGCLVSRFVIEDFTSQLVSQNHNKLFLWCFNIPMKVDSLK